MITELQLRNIFIISYKLSEDISTTYIKFLKDNNLYNTRNYNLLVKYSGLYLEMMYRKFDNKVDFNKLITELYRYHKLKYLLNDK